MSNTITKVREAALRAVDPLVLFALGKGVYDNDALRLLIREGLATQTVGRSYGEWTTDGYRLLQLVEALLEEPPTAATSEPEPSAPDAPTVDTAIACIREAARARGGVL